MTEAGLRVLAFAHRIAMARSATACPPRSAA